MAPTAMGLVTSETTSLGGLVRRANFQVPVNQRPWAWGKKEVDRFLDDVEVTRCRFFEPDAYGAWRGISGSRSRLPHFLGALVFYEPSPTSSDYEIVDGQQRLTLVTILAAACLEQLEPLELQTQGEQVRTKLVKRLRKWIEGIGASPRVVLDTQYDLFYRKYCLEARSNGDRNKVMKPIASTGRAIFRRDHPSLYDLKRAADQCRNWLSGVLGTNGDDAKLTIIDSIEGTLDKHMQCLAVVVSDYAQGLAIFRSLNSTGLGLTDADNLKNEVFRRSPRRDANYLRQVYFDALAALPNRDMTGFLRLRHVARTGALKRSDVFEGVVRDELGAGTNMRAVVEGWKADAEHIRRFHEPDPTFAPEVRRDLSAIRTLEVTYAWSFLLAAAIRYLPAESENFKKCVRLARDFSFRMLTVPRSRDVGPLDDGFVEACGLLQKRKHLTAVREVLRARSSDDAFSDDFSRYRETRKRVQYYVLWEIERELAGGSGLVPAPYGTTVDIEHVLPQRFDSAQPKEWKSWKDAAGGPLPIHGEYVNRLGNLLILEGAINSKMNSGEFVAKCTGNYPVALATLADGKPRPSFKDSALRLPTLLVSKGYSKWDPATIDEWQAELAAIALKVWPL